MRKVINCLTEDNPVINKKLRKVSVDEGLKIAEELLNILSERKDGIGLAANQVGYDAAVAVVNVKEPLILINPVIKEQWDEVPYYEGCLSYPSLYLNIKRPKGVVVKYQNVDGDLIHATFEELAARVFQHEMDHMQGQNFTEYVSNFMLKSARKKQKKLLKKGKQDGRVY